MAVGIAEEVELVSMELTDEILATLLEFDADSQRLNFPKDSPNREETADRIRREYAEEPGGMQLVMHQGRIVGCLFLRTRYNPYRQCKYVDLRNIYLLPEYRGKGIAGRLLQTLEDYARRNGCRYLFLGTSSDNEAARRAFEAFGFRSARVIMEKELR